jgi:hypothetical protein
LRSGFVVFFFVFVVVLLLLRNLLDLVVLLLTSELGGLFGRGFGARRGLSGVVVGGGFSLSW